MKRGVKIFRNIMLTIGLLVVVTYVIFGLTSFSEIDSDLMCKEIQIEIQGSIPLLQEENVHEILTNEGLHPIGRAVAQLKLEQIEHKLMDNFYVKQAICYYTPSGKVFLKITLREPKFLVSAAESYYVDDEKAMMPVPIQGAAYVPVVSGRITKTMALNEIFDFISFLEKHPFWNAQIAQIHVHSNKQIELVPRIGNSTILLGDIDAYEEKLERVYLLYSQAFNTIGWNRYKRLDLRFENQIVAVKY